MILRGHAQRHGDSMNIDGTMVTSVTAAIAYITSLEYAEWSFDWVEIIDRDHVIAEYDGDAWAGLEP